MNLSNFVRQHWAAFRALLVLTVITGLAYPLFIWLVAQVPGLSDNANGSIIEVDGKPYLLETALRADFALVDAFLADYIGNLYYALTARNFNPVMAMAADTVIVEAENIVPVGVISPDNVVTPAPVVDYIISHA